MTLSNYSSVACRSGTGLEWIGVSRSDMIHLLRSSLMRSDRAWSGNVLTSGPIFGCSAFSASSERHVAFLHGYAPHWAVFVIVMIQGVQ